MFSGNKLLTILHLKNSKKTFLLPAAVSNLTRPWYHSPVKFIFREYSHTPEA